MSTSTDIAPDAAGLRVARVELAAALRAAALHGFNEGIDTIGLGGERLAGEGELDVTAFTIHLAAHRARPDAQCVLHTHMPYATALSMTADGLDTRASQNAMYFHGRIARLAYGGLADAEEEGARIAEALAGGISVLLMDNHGVLVVGESVADAWHQLYFLERACQVQVLAQSTGSPLLRVPEAVAEHTAAQFRSIGGQAETFAAVRRELDRVNPGYDR